MDWDQLATVSQLLTGAATLAVAVFLWSQLKVQHRASERDFAFANENRLQDVFISYYSNESASSLFWKGHSDFEGLLPAEENRYRMMCLAMYFHMVNAWRLERDGDDLARFRVQWENILRHPGQRRVYEKWGRRTLGLQPSLLEFTEEIYREMETQAA